jgi:ATP-dependent helicase/nuclease subunit A
LPDQASRDYAVDPRHNVVLEASAGTGKTFVLVRRYLALLDVGVSPANILAITFTRKAAAEMRERIIAELRRRAALSEDGRRRWRQLRDRLTDITISTIDAFCLGLLGEFPLEADLDPGFAVADETDAAALVEDMLDLTLAVARGRADQNEGLRLVLAQIPQRRLMRALAHLVDRRVVAGEVLARVLARVPRDLTADARQDRQRREERPGRRPRVRVGSTFRAALRPAASRSRNGVAQRVAGNRHARRPDVAP